MSVMNATQVKVVLPRSGPMTSGPRCTAVMPAKTSGSGNTWRCLRLRVNGGWTVDHIGRAFGHPKGHVTRCLRLIERELRSRFARRTTCGSTPTSMRKMRTTSAWPSRIPLKMTKPTLPQSGRLNSPRRSHPR